MLKHNKLFAVLSLFLVGLLSGGFMTVSAASDPEIRLTADGLNDGKATVTLSLENIPSGKNVEYAQIELACKTEDFDIVSESFAMAAKPSQIKTTVKQDAGKASILLLKYGYQGRLAVFGLHLVERLVDEPYRNTVEVFGKVGLPAPVSYTHLHKPGTACGICIRPGPRRYAPGAIHPSSSLHCL